MLVPFASDQAGPDRPAIRRVKASFDDREVELRQMGTFEEVVEVRRGEDGLSMEALHTDDRTSIAHRAIVRVTVGLITRRSRVRIPPPLLRKRPLRRAFLL